MLFRSLDGVWREPGVWNLEQLDPDPFMRDMNQYGLPWTVVELDRLTLDD